MVQDASRIGSKKVEAEARHDEDAADQGQESRLPHRVHRRDDGHPQDGEVGRVGEAEGEHASRLGQPERAVSRAAGRHFEGERPGTPPDLREVGEHG